MRLPALSVVTATYNRSNVLRTALESLMDQTFTDWEAIVVGDACTDDSEDVVASFGDVRLRWHNREENFGEQSGPNNDGVRLARGRYLAFLNHDDLWFPDHLEVGVAELERTGADLVFALAAAIGDEGAFGLSGITPDGRYGLHTVAAASTWVLRRETAERVGPWRGFREHRTYPSEDWLARAHRMGLDLRRSPRLTVAQFSSAGGVYARRPAEDQREALDRMRREPDALRADLLTEGALAWGIEAQWPRPVRTNLRIATRHAVYRASARLGRKPMAVTSLLRGKRKAWWMAESVRNRGLPPDHAARR